MMYTVDSTTATSATLYNLQCNTEYTVWAHARGGLNDTRSVSILASLPARGMMCIMSSIWLQQLVSFYHPYPPHSN